MSRGGPSPRNIRVPSAAARAVSADDATSGCGGGATRLRRRQPRGSRGGAATRPRGGAARLRGISTSRRGGGTARLHGLSTSRPRWRVSAEYPRVSRGGAATRPRTIQLVAAFRPPRVDRAASPPSARTTASTQLTRVAARCDAQRIDARSRAEACVVLELAPRNIRVAPRGGAAISRRRPSCFELSFRSSSGYPRRAPRRCRDAPREPPSRRHRDVDFAGRRLAAPSARRLAPRSRRRARGGADSRAWRRTRASSRRSSGRGRGRSDLRFCSPNIARHPRRRRVLSSEYPRGSRGGAAAPTKHV